MQMPYFPTLLGAVIVFLPSFGCRPQGLAVQHLNSYNFNARMEKSLFSKEEELAKHVVVIINHNSDASEEIGQYYAKKRHIPAANVFSIGVPTTEAIAPVTFYNSVIVPLKAFLKKNRNSIDYIVTTKGDPLTVNGFSADATIAAMDLLQPSIFTPKFQMNFHPNPYFGKDVPFSHKKFGIYLVDRLAGYSVSDVKKLVDHSIEARPEKGTFFFQESPTRTHQTYGALQNTMVDAYNYLTDHGYKSTLTDFRHFLTIPDRCEGYVTWGSNHGFFDEKQYSAVKYYPGALAETYVSTSARTLSGAVPGQSEIGPLIRSGVTGVKGYVSEPYTLALCRADILFERYVNGFNLAESFYAASPVIEWKDVVIGDPLCAPYSVGK